MTATPNSMPRKANPLHQKVLAGLIETKPFSWSQKKLGKDKDGKEVVNKVKVTGTALRYPLAQNVSEDNVERIARRWVR
ncbi:hypothetical protein KIW74_gp32 [Mycobacterium phage Kimona]|uniref:Uncharacterized protein n=1 Tax=Mycobacterium phage Kimona TaxID=2024295 RepID=A0A249XVG0_9CAUD|nr:hypothetical protein KIW74_gp32 [Mycobacterium phage Kimona]ASZ75496.1 hypothetical protein PBI_KIMONA_60 [Mycobacterium phage Kimona]